MHYAGNNIAMRLIYGQKLLDDLGEDLIWRHQISDNLTQDLAIDPGGAPCRWLNAMQEYVDFVSLLGDYLRVILNNAIGQLGVFQLLRGAYK